LGNELPTKEGIGSVPWGGGSWHLQKPKPLALRGSNFKGLKGHQKLTKKKPPGRKMIYK